MIPKVSLGRRGLDERNHKVWAAYAIIHLEDAVGFILDVDNGAIVNDQITQATKEEAAAITEALSRLWEQWSASGGEIPSPKASGDTEPPTASGDFAIPSGKAHLHVAGAFVDVFTALHRLEAVCSAVARQLDAMKEAP